MQIVARPAIIRRLGLPLSSSLLLEGSWPEHSHRPNHWALDELLSPAWHALDAEAQQLARAVITAPTIRANPTPETGTSAMPATSTRTAICSPLMNAIFSRP